MADPPGWLQFALLCGGGRRIGSLASTAARLCVESVVSTELRLPGSFCFSGSNTLVTLDTLGKPKPDDSQPASPTEQIATLSAAPASAARPIVLWRPPASLGLDVLSLAVLSFAVLR